MGFITKLNRKERRAEKRRDRKRGVGYTKRPRVK